LPLAWQFSPAVLAVPVASHSVTVVPSQNADPGAHTFALHAVPTQASAAPHGAFCHPKPSDWLVANRPSWHTVAPDWHI
jgi:hypothetical protein